MATVITHQIEMGIFLGDLELGIFEYYQNAEFSVRSFAFWCANWPGEIRRATLEIASATMTEREGTQKLHRVLGRLRRLKEMLACTRFQINLTRAAQLLVIVHESCGTYLPGLAIRFSVS